jgi:CDP-paratose 2-epimerase
MNKVLITGGAGFIGTHTADYFLNNGDEVTIFDNFSRKGTRENITWLKEKYGDKEIKIVEGDIRTEGKLNDEVKDQNLVIHLAAQVAVTTSVKNPREDFEINAMGTLNLLESVRNNSPETVVIYASTNKVYGEMEKLGVIKGEHGYGYTDRPKGISELQNLDFHSPYGCSKGAAEQYVHDYSKIYGLKTVVFRQSCIYGTRQFGIEDQGWISWFTIASILNKPTTVYGDGYQVRDVLWVEDLVKAYDLAFVKIKTTSGQVYNIGGGADNSLSVNELLNKLNPKIKPAYSTWRPGDQKVYISDIGKVSKELGWKPEISVDQGLEGLISWTKENKALIESVLRSY